MMSKPECDFHAGISHDASGWPAGSANLQAVVAASGLEAARARIGLMHGTLEPVVLTREKLKRGNRKSQSTAGGRATGHPSGHRDGTIRSSNEVPITVGMVRRVLIPKADGKERPLGIPTVGDRVAQRVVKMELEPKVEPLFHPDSYGYRPKKSALDAVGKCRERCWRHGWVVDLDIRGFFDNIDHALMMHAVRKHTDCPWTLLYIERWLKAPAEAEDGTRIVRTRGTPQGGVISPLLANLFLHHVFDEWMKREHPGCPFERYADDIVIHCPTQAQAQEVKRAVEERLRRCKLEAHPEKTRIVYCREGVCRQDPAHIQFDFLGYTFRPRSAKGRRGIFTGFLPAISAKAKKAIVAEIRGWQLQRWSDRRLIDLARTINPKLQGWINYYGRYYPSALYRTLCGLNSRLVRWTRRAHKRFKAHGRQARLWLRRLASEQPTLFAHWRLGIAP